MDVAEEHVGTEEADSDHIIEIDNDNNRSSFDWSDLSDSNCPPSIDASNTEQHQHQLQQLQQQQQQQQPNQVVLFYEQEYHQFAMQYIEHLRNPNVVAFAWTANRTRLHLPNTKAIFLRVNQGNNPIFGADGAFFEDKAFDMAREASVRGDLSIVIFCPSASGWYSSIVDQPKIQQLQIPAESISFWSPPKLSLFQSLLGNSKVPEVLVPLAQTPTFTLENRSRDQTKRIELKDVYHLFRMCYCTVDAPFGVSRVLLEALSHDSIVVAKHFVHRNFTFTARFGKQDLPKGKPITTVRVRAFLANQWSISQCFTDVSRSNQSLKPTQFTSTTSGDQCNATASLLPDSFTPHLVPNVEPAEYFRHLLQARAMHLPHDGEAGRTANEMVDFIYHLLGRLNNSSGPSDAGDAAPADVDTQDMLALQQPSEGSASTEE